MAAAARALRGNHVPICVNVDVTFMATGAALDAHTDITRTSDTWRLLYSNPLWFNALLQSCPTTVDTASHMHPTNASMDMSPPSTRHRTCPTLGRRACLNSPDTCVSSGYNSVVFPAGTLRGNVKVSAWTSSTSVAQCGRRSSSRTTPCNICAYGRDIADNRRDRCSCEVCVAPITALPAQTHTHTCTVSYEPIICT